jgi:hypothetical protein
MHNEYDAYLDELLEEAYLEGYYDSIDDYNDYYTEGLKYTYTDDELNNMSTEELKALKKRLIKGTIGTGVGTAAFGAWAATRPKRVKNLKNYYKDIDSNAEGYRSSLRGAGYDEESTDKIVQASKSLGKGLNKVARGAAITSGVVSAGTAAGLGRETYKRSKAIAQINRALKARRGQ